MTNYKKYSLGQVENFLYDAMGAAEATPQEIYDVIVGVVKDNYYTHQKQASDAHELFVLLNGGGKKNIDEHDDFMPPSGDSDTELEECTYGDMIAKGYWMSADGFWMPPAKEEDKVLKSWVLPVDDEGVITLPEDLLKQTGWKEGDVLVYEIGDGGVIVRKKELLSDDNMVAAGYVMSDDGFWILNSEGC